jgi:hypothetical protein
VLRVDDFGENQLRFVRITTAWRKVALQHVVVDPLTEAVGELGRLGPGMELMKLPGLIALE